MSIAHVVIIIKSEVSTFPIVTIFFRGCVPEVFVIPYSVTYCIYVPGKPGRINQSNETRTYRYLQQFVRMSIFCMRKIDSRLRQTPWMNWTLMRAFATDQITHNWAKRIRRMFFWVVRLLHSICVIYEHSESYVWSKLLYLPLWMCW